MHPGSPPPQGTQGFLMLPLPPEAVALPTLALAVGGLRKQAPPQSLADRVTGPQATPPGKPPHQQARKVHPTGEGKRRASFPCSFHWLPEKQLPPVPSLHKAIKRKLFEESLKASESSHDGIKKEDTGFPQQHVPSYLSLWICEHVDKILEGNSPPRSVHSDYLWVVGLPLIPISFSFSVSKSCAIKMCHFSNQKTSMKLTFTRLCPGESWGVVQSHRLHSKLESGSRELPSAESCLCPRVRFAGPRPPHGPRRPWQEAKGAVALAASSGRHSGLCSGRQARAGTAGGRGQADCRGSSAANE